MGPAGEARQELEEARLRDAAFAPTVAPPDLPPPAPAGVKGRLSLTLFSASGDRMAELVILPQRSVTVALRFEDPVAGAAGPAHEVTFTRRGNRLFVSDVEAESGLYLKLSPGEPWLLATSDRIRIGDQTLLFVAAPPEDALDPEQAVFDEPFLGLLEVLGHGSAGQTLVVPVTGIQCGREAGHLTFPDDRFVSGRHCAISRGEDGLAHVSDLGSTNGTFVHLSEEHPIQSGDVLRAGPIFFRVDF